MSKTIEQKKQEITNYLNKTSLHLFTNDKGTFMKVIPFEANGESYYAYINFTQGDLKFYINTQYTEKDYEYYKSYGFARLQEMKSNIFPTGHNLRSIPNFKAARVVTSKIKEILSTYDGKNTSELKVQVESLLSELHLVSI